MKKLHLIIISTLFIMFSANCIGTETLDKKEAPASQSSYATEDIKYWTNDVGDKEVQNLMHNQYENAQFEVKQQPILVKELTKKILSFINGEASPSYITIGIAEELYNYTKISEIDFNSSNDKKDGIYGIMDKNKNIIKCYQVIGGEEVELEFNYKANKREETQKKFFLKQFKNKESDTELDSEELGKYFKNFRKNNSRKPINSNAVRYIELPITIKDISNKEYSYDTDELYIEEVKKYIKNNTTVKEFELIDKYIKTVKYIKPYNQQKNIIIIEIIPGNSKLIALKEEKLKYFYGRVKQGSALDYGSDLLNLEEKAERQNKRLENRKSKYSDKTGGASLDLMDLFEYLSSGEIDKCKELLKIKPGLTLMMDSGGNNLLIAAVNEKQASFIQYLLENNYKINYYHVNNKKENALDIAKRMNETNILQLLEKHINNK